MLESHHTQHKVMTPLSLERPVGSVVHCLRTFALSLVEGPNARVTPHATQVMTPLSLGRPVGSVVHCLRTFALS